MKNLKDEKRVAKLTNRVKKFAVVALIGLLAFPLFVGGKIPVPTIDCAEMVLETTSESDVTDDDISVW